MVLFFYLIIFINKRTMASKRHININFPFNNSLDGFFLDMNSDERNAIKADLMHLILTRKGQRLYNPEFGTDLLKFIFEPNDSLTLNGIREEITTVVNKYLPKLNITEIIVEPSTESEYAAIVRIDYVITDTVFEVSDFVMISV